MTTRTWLPLATVVLFLAPACSSNPKPKAQTPAGPVQVKPSTLPKAVPPPPDPIASLIATSQSHFEAGERELNVGHLERARAEFDRAVDVLLESPYGARTDARLRDHFDRLVDRINAYEVTALRQGDGFAEKKEEPASIDVLLDMAAVPSRKRPRKQARPLKKISLPPSTTFRFPRTHGYSSTSNCFRAGCATSFRMA